MPGPVLSAFYESFNFPTLVISILQMKKLSLHEVKFLVEGYATC